MRTVRELPSTNEVLFITTQYLNPSTSQPLNHLNPSTISTISPLHHKKITLMLYKSISTKIWLPLFGITLLFSACLKEPDFGDDPNDPEKARVRVEITDAPIDDPNVKGVFVTVAGIEIDGQAWAGFDGKTTVDLLALHSGQTSLLGEGELEAGLHGQVVLILDTEEDEDGNSPGCYVLDDQGNKQKLSGGSDMEMQVQGSFSTQTGATTQTVIDVDVRKAIAFQSGSETAFEFVSEAELQQAVRIVDKSKTGSIDGDVTDGVSGSDKVIVYAYNKGDFTMDERLPQGASDITFKNAVSSAVVAADGTFKLAFLDSGDYELHFVSYQEDDDGNLQARGELQMSVLGNVVIDLLGIKVEATETVDVEVKVVSLLFF